MLLAPGPGAGEEPQTQGCHQGGGREGVGGEGQALEEDPGPLAWRRGAGKLGLDARELGCGFGHSWVCAGGGGFLNLPLKRWVSSLIHCSLPSPCLQEELKMDCGLVWKTQLFQIPHRARHRFQYTESVPVSPCVALSTGCDLSLSVLVFKMGVVVFSSL